VEDNLDAGSALNYAFYNAGTAPSYFVGDLALGLTPAQSGSRLGVKVKTTGSSDGISLFNIDNTEIAKLYTDAGKDAVLELLDSGGNTKISIQAEGVSYFTGGDVGFGTTNSPSYPVDVGGVIRAVVGSDSIMMLDGSFAGLKINDGTGPIYLGDGIAQSGTECLANFIATGLGHVRLFDADANRSLAIQSTNTTVIAAERYTANANGANLVFYKSRNATLGSHTAVQAGDSCGVISAYGSDGANFDEVARISLQCDSISGGNIGGKILFQTATSGGVLTDRLTISETGAATFEANVHADGQIGSNTGFYGGYGAYYQIGDGNWRLTRPYNEGYIFRITYPDKGFELQSTYSGPIVFKIEENGDTGIGTTSPGARLDVKGSTNDGSTNVLTWQDSDGASLGVIDTNGNVGIGTTSPGARLDIKGSTNDGSTNILTWQDSDGANLGGVNTQGKLTTVGSRIHKATLETGTTTLGDTDEVVVVDTDSGPVTINLPPGTNGQHYVITNAGSSGNDVTLTPDGSENLLLVNADQLLHDGETLALYYEDDKGWVAA